MDREFEKSLCLSSGITFMMLSLLISIPNSFVLIALYRNPVRCFRKPFAVFLVFIAAVDFFAGSVVCAGQAVIRFLCAFGNETLPRHGDVVKLLGYIGVNSSILLVTAMAVDRFISVVFPHFYLRKVKSRNLVLCNAAIIGFSSVFASLQVTGIPMDVYLLIDIHLHTTFPLVTMSSAYTGIFLVLRKRSQVDFQRGHGAAGNPTLRNLRRVNNAKKEQKFATTSFLILLFLILSLVPYFIAVILEADCPSCQGEKWLFVFKESSEVFLFLNSVINPFLTTFRISELKQSVKTVFCTRR